MAPIAVPLHSSEGTVSEQAPSKNKKYVSLSAHVMELLWTLGPGQDVIPEPLQS